MKHKFIKDDEGNIIAVFDDKDKTFSIINFNNIDTFKFVNPPDQFIAFVADVKKYKEVFTNKPKVIANEYITNYINYDSLPINIQNSITKFTMKEYGKKRSKKK